MQDVLVKIVDAPDPAGPAWTSELWSGFPGTPGTARLAGGGVFTKAQLEAPGRGGVALDEASVLKKVRRENNEDDIFVDIGLRLYELLEQTGIALEWRVRRDAAADGLRTYLDVPASLATWPWELLAWWKDPQAPGLFDSAFKVPQHPIVRVRPRAAPPQPWTDAVVRILLIAGQQQLDPNDASATASAELRLIREVFHKSNKSVLVELCEEPPTVGKLEERITNAQPHILHFIGHGNLDAAGTEFVLQFKSESPGATSARNPKSWEWSTNQIGQFVARSVSKPRLVVLNSCHSSQPELAATPVAGALLAAGVQAVVGAQAALQIDYARHFSRAFYGALAKGQPLDRAVVDARNDLSNAGRYGHKRRHWALPVLTVTAPAQGVLQFKAVDGRIASCEEAKDVYSRPGKFVNRTADRRSLLTAFSPAESAEQFRGVILHSDAARVGKGWLVKRSLRDFIDAGFIVRYATLVGATGGKTSIDVLEEWRGRPNFNSPVLETIPGPHFADFDQAIAEARRAPDAKGIERTFHAFKQGLQSARQNRPVLLALGRFRHRDFGGVPSKEFVEHLMSKLLLPIAADPPDPEVAGVHALLIARRHADLQTGLPDDFDEFALQRLSYAVEEANRMPSEGFRRHKVEEFTQDQVENYFDEFSEFSTADGIEDLRGVLRALVKNLSWSPSQLNLIEPAVQQLTKTGR